MAFLGLWFLLLQLRIYIIGSPGFAFLATSRLVILDHVPGISCKFSLVDLSDLINLIRVESRQRLRRRRALLCEVFEDFSLVGRASVERLVNA